MRFYCHDDGDGDNGGGISLTEEMYVDDLRSKGLLGPDAVIEAATPEEAAAIHHLRQGWKPYRPIGAASRCPTCGSWFYPEGSGVCWKCQAAKEAQERCNHSTLELAPHPYRDSWDDFEGGEPFKCSAPFCCWGPEDPIHIQEPHTFEAHPMDKDRSRECGLSEGNPNHVTGDESDA